MATYIAFLRAVNVGGRWVKMADLRTLLSDKGFGDVETHIQSGNVKVTSSMRSRAKVEAALRDVISTHVGFDVPVVVRTPAELTALASEADGLPTPLSQEARRYVAFTTGGLDAAGRAALEAWDKPGERAQHVGEDIVMFLDVPSHEAKLTNARLEKLTGVTSTARDIKVVRALAAKWGS